MLRPHAKPAVYLCFRNQSEAEVDRNFYFVLIYFIILLDFALYKGYTFIGINYHILRRIIQNEVFQEGS